MSRFPNSDGLYYAKGDKTHNQIAAAVGDKR